MSGINNDKQHHFHAHGVHPAGKDKAKGQQNNEAVPEQAHHGAKRGEDTAVNPDVIFAGLQQQSSGALSNLTVGRLQTLFSGNFHTKATRAIDIAANELGLDPHNANHAMLLSDIAVGAL
jgi:hypothetical protein